MLKMRLLKKLKGFTFNYMLLVLCLGVLIDVFFISTKSPVSTLAFFIIYMILSAQGKIARSVSKWAFLGFFVAFIFFLIFKNETLAEKNAIWAFAMLVAVVYQRLISLKKLSKDI